MPQKIRQLKATLSKAGFYARTAKGSHTVWSHPKLSDVRITFSGKDGDDVPPYLAIQARKALEQLERK